MNLKNLFSILYIVIIIHWGRINLSNFEGGNGTIYINEIEKLKETEYYLRKKRSKEHKKNLDLNNLKYQSITSDLGYTIDIPLHFEKKRNYK